MNAQAASVSAPLIALVGNPNCGKTALFNLLTGSRQKVANYAGVTVERKEGNCFTASGRRMRVLDLPGAYSLEPRTPDEQITCDTLFGAAHMDDRPDYVVAVCDANNLRQGLKLTLALQRLGCPMVLALNMMDLARKRGLDIDVPRLASELGITVVETVATRTGGARDLTRLLDGIAAAAGSSWVQPRTAHSGDVENDHAEVRRILRAVGADRAGIPETTVRIDRIALHPVVGPILLAATLFLMFQAVFAWAQAPMNAINGSVSALGTWLAHALPESHVRSLLVDGVLAGLGSVIVFLPQIVILFFFILLLEDTGYLPRAAFMLDRLMGGVGLSGRSFIPLLSSFACAIPGIMATRTIRDPRDRLTTIMIAPLMTCSARLPVYTLVIGAFIPHKQVWGGLQLQGLVLFGLYVFAVVSAMLVALILKLPKRGQRHPLTLELPAYHAPNLRNLAIGLWQRVQIFLTRVGTIILSLMIVLWFLSSFPAPPPGATDPAITYSIAGRIGSALAVVFGPIGFNWQISIALVPGLAAREVAVGALGTVYALSAANTNVASALTPLIAASWSLPTALSLLAWYVFAPQCLSTLATVKRETNSWRFPIIMAAYLFGLAYFASFVTYRVALAWAGS
jgi:ferrous iron transport protein B